MAPAAAEPHQLALRLVRSEPTARGYRQRYAFAGPAGATLVQQVQTEVTFELGAQPLVEYRGHYTEFFVLDADGAGLPDLHEFDVQLDGWDMAQVRDQLRRAGVRGPDGRRVRFDPPPRVRLRKRYLLSLGDVHASQVALGRASGARFGFLAEGPGGASAAELLLHPPEGPPLRQPAQAVASGYPSAGHGVFTAGSAWVLEERYSYVFASQRSTFADGGGYRLEPLG